MTFYIPFGQFVESSNRSGNFSFRIEAISWMYRRFLFALSMQLHTIIISFFLNILLSFVSHLISDTSELGSQLDGE